MLKIYKYILIILLPIVKLNLNLRVKKGKEEKKRIKERFGLTKIKRPYGKLIWIHASSVGEFNSATGLINILLKSHKILVTTSTVTASYYCKQIFNNKVIHQYAPLDHETWILNFLKHWKPNLVIWIESDLWPNTIRTIKKNNIKQVLINLRISPKSFKKWKIIKKSFSQILSNFDKIFVQSKEDLNNIKKLTNVKINFVGNLKLTSLPQKINYDKLNKLKKITLSKKIILIASSHKKEEYIILQNIKEIVKNNNVFIIIVPRHPNRALELTKMVKKNFLECSLESNRKILDNTKCIIAKSLGEMSTYYKLSNIVILGGSFVEMGGHNPIEPARYKCAIITGPSVYNWKNIFADMINKKACILCKSDKNLKKNVNYLLKNKSENMKIVNNALKYTKKNQMIISNIIENLKPFIKDNKNA